MVWHAPSANLNSLLQLHLILSCIQPLDQVLRVKISTDRVLGELRGFHKDKLFLYSVEVIDLVLDSVSVGVEIVHARGGPVVDGPDWVDPFGVTLGISAHEVGKGGVGEADMTQTARVGVFIFQIGHVSDGDTVVFLVVGDKTDKVVLIGGMGPEKLLVELHHLVKLVGAEHHVGKFDRTVSLACGFDLGFRGPILGGVTIGVGDLVDIHFFHCFEVLSIENFNLSLC